MHTKALWNYFLDINMFNLPFCFIIGLTSGFLSSIIVFPTFGVAIGYLGYHTFKKNQYYAYYNLGFTKINLIKKVCFLNLILSAVFYLLFILIK
jgi:hypothetical protein